RLAAAGGGVEGQVLQQFFHDGVQAPCAYVLGALVNVESQLGQPLYARVGKVQNHIFSAQQGAVLLGQRRIGIAQYAYEVLSGQRVQLYAYGKASLQFGNQIGWPRQMESARSNKQ